MILYLVAKTCSLFPWRFHLLHNLILPHIQLWWQYYCMLCHGPTDECMHTTLTCTVYNTCISVYPVQVLTFSILLCLVVLQVKMIITIKYSLWLGLSHSLVKNVLKSFLLMLKKSHVLNYFTANIYTNEPKKFHLGQTHNSTGITSSV